MRDHSLPQFLAIVLCAVTLIGAWGSGDDAALRRGDILVAVTGKGIAGGHIEAAVDIAVAPSSLWALMVDCAGAPAYVPKMKHCKVLESAADASSDLREQQLKFLPGFADLRLRFRSHYTPPTQIRFVKEGGDLAILQGSWRIEPIGAGHSRLVYQADMVTKTPFPGNLVRDGMRRDTRAILHAVRQEALRRAASASPAASETASPW